ncbi:MAG: chromate transporter [Acholeplasmataceae bacterium]|jgi:chromate transporter
MTFLKLLKLFWTFFKISLFTFGGGYSMIPLINQEMINNGYLTETQVFQFIGIAESTPGPFAINIATFAGYETYGFLGALFATLGVVMPSFLIILFIAAISDKFIKHPLVKKVLDVLKPAIIGFILAAALNVSLKSVLGDFQNFDFSWQALVIFAAISILSYIFKEKFSPILLILTSGLLGMGLYLI